MKSKLLLSVLFLQIVFYVTIFCNISIARQVIGFFYLTFLPGFIILKLLRLDKLNSVETILFSLGFSIAFLMVAGFFINEFGLLLGVLTPLSVMPLIITLNIFICIGLVAAYLSSEGCYNFFNFKSLRLLPSFLPVLLPLVLSVIGARYILISGSNIIIIFMIVSIVLLFIVGVLSKKFLLHGVYPYAIFIIAISLLFHTSLMSSYIYEGDVHLEYFAFKNTQSSAYWNSTMPCTGLLEYDKIYSMLSITVLPTIYSNLLNIDSTWVLKIVFSLIFSFVPLALYQLWSGYLGKKYAFISTFFFMAFDEFYTEMIGLNRQMIAELFFALLLLTILNYKIKPFGKILCFSIFSFCLVTSHYGVASIFLIFILLVFVLSFIIRQSSRRITASMIILFSLIMFVWYIYTTKAAVFESFLSSIDYVRRQLDDFFNFASREAPILAGLGLETPPTIWNSIGRAFTYITEFLIVVGFIDVVKKRKGFHFGEEYFTLVLIAMSFLAALILIPGLANIMNMTRFYHILLFFLAPLCAIGAEAILKLISKSKHRIEVSFLLLIIFVPYFLFQTQLIYEVTISPSRSLPLSKYRMSNIFLFVNRAYVNDWKASGASWLGRHVEAPGVSVYKDWSAHEMSSYGMLPYAQLLQKTTQISSGEFVYLSYLNVVDGLIVTQGGRVFNSTELSFVPDLDIVYSNGGPQVYLAPPSR